MGGPVTRRLLESGVVRIGVILFLMAALVQSIAHFFGLIAPPGAVLLDFDVFYVAGRMVWEGTAGEAYSTEAMAEAQRQFSGADDFMPWGYPPQFDLVAAGLALMPHAVSFTVFILLTFGAYLWVMRRLAGACFYPVLLAISPALVVNMRAGQNGFLTGALVGAFCLLMLRRHTSAGLPLGLMVIKPHLALGLGISVLAARRWAVVAWAAAAVILTSALATLALGTEIWPAFLEGAAEASAYLHDGAFPFFRMTSLFAALGSLGVPPAVALPLHGALAVAACAGVAYAAVRLSDPRRALAVALFGTLLVSPYNYDYDLTLLGVGLALIAPDFLARARDRDVLLLLVMAMVACGSGLAVVAAQGHEQFASAEQVDIAAVSLGFFGYVGLMLVIALVLSREPGREAAGATSP